MMRFIFNSFFTLGLLAALVLFFAFNPLVEWRLQHAMKNTLNQPLTFESVRLSPFTGTGDIGGVTIKGINEFENETLLYIPRVSVEFAPLSLWQNILVINNITVHDAKIEFAGTVTNNNVSSMVQHLSGRRAESKADDNSMRPFYNKRYTLGAADQKGTSVAIEPSLLKGHSISADVPASSIAAPLGEGSATLDQIVSFLILDVLSRSPEAITGEFNLLKEGLVGLGLLDKEVLEPKEEKPSLMQRIRLKFSSLF